MPVHVCVHVLLKHIMPQMGQLHLGLMWVIHNTCYSNSLQKGKYLSNVKLKKNLSCLELRNNCSTCKLCSLYKMTEKELVSGFNFVHQCSAVLNTVCVTCIHSETTEGTQFDTLLEMVADLGRNIFKLFQVEYSNSRFYSVWYVPQTTTELSTYCTRTCMYDSCSGFYFCSK